MTCGFRAKHEYHNRQFVRAIYGSENGIRLSGVGSVERRVGKRIINHREESPLDKNDTWETMGDWFTVLEEEEGTGVGGPKPRRQNAFMWHEECWKALMGHFDMGQVDLDALFEACRVAPSVGVLQPSGPRYWNRFWELTIEKLQGSAKDFPTSSVSKSYGAKRNETDYFARLPLEIQEAIAIDLPTHEFFKLRLASRAMAALFSSRGFWMSRFSPSRERGFLRNPILQSELNRKSTDNARKRKRKANAKSIDWRLLYHCNNPTTKTARDGDFRLQIRREFWQINRWLAEACFMKVPGDGKGNQCTECTYKTDGCIAGTYCYTQDPKFNKDIYVRRFLVKMGIFSIRDPDSGRTYISGIEPFFDDRPSVILRYESVEVRIFDANPFGGLNVAYSDAGIHALQVFTSSSPSIWVGEPDEATDSLKRLTLDEIDMLCSTFDRTKLTMLEIRGADYKRREELRRLGLIE